MRTICKTLLCILCFAIVPAWLDATESPVKALNHAVFQRDFPITVKGQAKGRSGSFAVRFNGVTKQGRFSNNGKFSINFPAQSAGGPYDIEFRDNKGSFKAIDVYVGDIWVCVGQSNMVFPMTKMHKADTWKPAANDTYPLVRVSGGKNGWRPAVSIDVIKNMPGTPYYFGRELHKSLGVAIGLVPAGAGGTSLWEWTPPELHKLPTLRSLFQVMQERIQFYKNGKLPKKAGVNDYPKAKGFSSARYPYFPKKGFSNPNLVKLENWVSSIPSRGIIFWQGENDIGLSANYEHLFRAFIQRYQAKTKREFPFFFLQLPTYTNQPGGKTKYDGIVGLRDAQRRVSETEKNVEMVVSYDIYSRGIHPSKKEAYGARLANAVLGKVYEKDVIWQHASYDRIEVKGDTILVHFKNAGKGLRTSNGAPPMDFVIAGANQQFVSAATKIIDADTIAVKSPKISKPVAVRFAWQNSPNTNLVGPGNLPLSPFRSDDWELYPVE